MIELTADETEVLRRHVQLAKDIVASGDFDVARKLAADRDAGLREGLDCGRMTLTIIASAVRNATRSDLSRGLPNATPERLALLAEVTKLPQIIELAALAEKMKPLLLK